MQLTHDGGVVRRQRAEAAGDAEEHGQEAEGPEQEGSTADAVDDEEGADVAGDRQRLCAALDLE